MWLGGKHLQQATGMIVGVHLWIDLGQWPCSLDCYTISNTCAPVVRPSPWHPSPQLQPTCKSRIHGLISRHMQSKQSAIRRGGIASQKQQHSQLPGAANLPGSSGWRPGHHMAHSEASAASTSPVPSASFQASAAPLSALLTALFRLPTDDVNFQTRKRIVEAEVHGQCKLLRRDFEERQISASVDDQLALAQFWTGRKQLQARRKDANCC